MFPVRRLIAPRGPPTSNPWSNPQRPTRNERSFRSLVIPGTGGTHHRTRGTGLLSPPTLPVSVASRLFTQRDRPATPTRRLMSVERPHMSVPTPRVRPSPTDPTLESGKHRDTGRPRSGSDEQWRRGEGPDPVDVVPEEDKTLGPSRSGRRDCLVGDGPCRAPDSQRPRSRSGRRRPYRRGSRLVPPPPLLGRLRVSVPGFPVPTSPEPDPCWNMLDVGTRF